MAEGADERSAPDIRSETSSGSRTACRVPALLLLALGIARIASLPIVAWLFRNADWIYVLDRPSLPQ